MRLLWLIGGLTCVGVGGVGVVVPGLPTTVFFIMAAWCFSRSSRRMERWVLGLPGVGPLVADHRAGLGMPQRAKIMAIGCIVVAVTLSAFTVGDLLFGAAIAALAAVGVWYIACRVPTRERVLAERKGPEGSGAVSRG
ncbi:MAG: YbaN family protein [Acidimicrobiales bacterium]